MLYNVNLKKVSENYCISMKISTNHKFMQNIENSLQHIITIKKCRYIFVLDHYLIEKFSPLSNLKIFRIDITIFARTVALSVCNKM